MAFLTGLFTVRDLLRSQSDEDKLEGAATGNTDNTALYQLLVTQQLSIDQMREEYGCGLLALQRQVDEMKVCLLDAQRTAMEEQLREQRIQLC